MTDDGGLSRFQQRMQAIPVAVRQAIVPALIKSGEELGATVARLAPKDTGDLGESVHVTKPGESTPPFSQPGGERVAGEMEVLVTVGNEDVRYAHLVEYGTKKSRAQPFFWPAFRLSRKRLASRIKRAVSKAVKDNWGGS